MISNPCGTSVTSLRLGKFCMAVLPEGPRSRRSAGRGSPQQLAGTCRWKHVPLVAHSATGSLRTIRLVVDQADCREDRHNLVESNTNVLDQGVGVAITAVSVEPPVTPDVVGQVCRGAEGRGDGLVLSLGDGGDGLKLVGGELFDEGRDLRPGVVGKFNQGGQALWTHLGKGSERIAEFIDGSGLSGEAHGILLKEWVGSNGTGLVVWASPPTRPSRH